MNDKFIGFLGASDICNPIILTLDIIYLIKEFTLGYDSANGLSPSSSAAMFAQLLSAYVAGSLRIIIGLVFLISVILWILLKFPLSLIWRRVIEHKTPFFTLTFGGLSSIAATLNEVVKHF